MGTSRASSISFEAYCREKERAALAARLSGYTTVLEDPGGVDLLAIGSAWSRALFDGDFYRSAGSKSPDLPAVTLVHDWPADDPRGEGGPGPLGDATTAHLIHEGLARVDADGVLGGRGCGPRTGLRGVGVASRTRRAAPVARSAAASRPDRGVGKRESPVRRVPALQRALASRRDRDVATRGRPRWGLRFRTGRGFACSIPASRCRCAKP